MNGKRYKVCCEPCEQASMCCEQKSCCVECHCSYEELYALPFLPRELADQILREHEDLQRRGFPRDELIDHSRREMVYFRMYCPQDVIDQLDHDHEAYEANEMGLQPQSQAAVSVGAAQETTTMFYKKKTKYETGRKVQSPWNCPKGMYFDGIKCTPYASSALSERPILPPENQPCSPSQIQAGCQNGSDSAGNVKCVCPQTNMQRMLMQTAQRMPMSMQQTAQRMPNPLRGVTTSGPMGSGPGGPLIPQHLPKPTPSIPQHLPSPSTPQHLPSPTLGTPGWAPMGGSVAQPQAQGNSPSPQTGSGSGTCLVAEFFLGDESYTCCIDPYKIPQLIQSGHCKVLPEGMTATDLQAQGWNSSNCVVAKLSWNGKPLQSCCFSTQVIKQAILDGDCKLAATPGHSWADAVSGSVAAPRAPSTPSRALYR